jgi:hypothetical protein
MQDPCCFVLVCGNFGPYVRLHGFCPIHVTFYLYEYHGLLRTSALLGEIKAASAASLRDTKQTVCLHEQVSTSSLEMGDSYCCQI